ncbi:two-component system, NarL family, nitrate/nitrite response regulator NarL [Streptosporangium subroseum]|uniref:Two-component system, NarL family, nitrate/nitrite response regulator NarL n=1 Tax=Streptosporangium subroseum TaxID=106412 RepID=A0A239FZ48_9ACTN|nr:LuxR C-terminal-related transcriptional regulator [Streptosporangium subroseum]SNS62317.1 two-component system, NarL family, nitrate/nitrite response regulator NarL [Streptosporangium subroseum]
MTSTPVENAGTAHLNVAIFVGNELLQRGLETVLRHLPIVGRIHQCASPAHVERLIADDDLDIVILTSSWAQPVERGTRVKILMLLDETQARNPAFAAALRSDGFLIQQELTADSLGDTLRRMAAGEMPIPARLARELLSHAAVPAALPAGRRQVNLTPRESTTLDLLSEGLSNRQIARKLSISEHGAKRLVASVLLKLDAPNRTTAVVTAIKIGMIECT